MFGGGNPTALITIILTSPLNCKFPEKLLDRQERSLRRDAVASAYISVGRIDRLSRDPPGQPATEADAGPRPPPAGAATWSHEPEPSATVQKKQMFLSHLRLVQVSPRHRDGDLLLLIIPFCIIIYTG